MKDTWLLPCSLLSHLFSGNQLVCCWAHMARRWRRAETCCHLRAFVEVAAPFQGKSSEDSSHGQQLDCNLTRTPKPEAARWAVSRCLPHGNCEITNICWFKLLNLVNLLHSNKKQYAANRRGGFERVLIRGMSTWKGQEGKTWRVWGHENR